MGLKFFIGESGAGKSYQCIHALSKEAAENPEQQYYCIVPEQFTMQTQKDLVFASPGEGILNIDVLSFQRLAYRVFEEVGGDDRKVLEDIGKMLVIQKLMQEKKAELPYLGPLGGRPGCIDEMKSLLSEFFQYDQDAEKVGRMVASAPEGSLLSLKLKDVAKVYEAFGEYLADHGLIAAEEVLDQLCTALPLSERVRGSVMLFDGFTGFTPVQLKVMEVLLSLCREVWVTVTMDPLEEYGAQAVPDDLFYMSHQMISSLLAISPEAAEPFFITAREGGGRFASSPALSFLEQHLFRHSREVYKKKCPELDAFYGATRA
ncbi:MAG: helicase-exonuclease AddAB subunit AddB, partial [Blautia sp.]|nr:helicase-exonuclease AddAB subunit AddB [Blautia sp.]